jgi:hypothetical protein
MRSGFPADQIGACIVSPGKSENDAASGRGPRPFHSEIFDPCYTLFCWLRFRTIFRMVFYTLFSTPFSSWWVGWGPGRATRCETGQSQGTLATIFFPALRRTGVSGRPRWGPFSRGNFPLCTRRRRDGFGGLWAGLARWFLGSPLSPWPTRTPGVRQRSTDFRHEDRVPGAHPSLPDAGLV